MDETQQKPKNWRRDYFAWCEFNGLWRPLLFIVIIIAVGKLSLWLLSNHHSGGPEVIVYTSQDQVYAEPLLQEFERRSGIKVRAVYDSEAVKTVGLVNRLIAEKDHPQCDVFWNNEEMRTRQLEKMGLLAETNGWTAFGLRLRMMVVNTRIFNATNQPPEFFALTNATWRGRVALAYPLFGTTSTHFLALRQRLGEKAWLDWCRALQANHPLLVDGNSVVVKMVGRGQAWLGLTDSDDIMAGAQEGLPVASLPMEPIEGLALPNTAAVLRDAPHAAAARRLVDYLKGEGVYQYLFSAGALQGRLEPADTTRGMDWNTLLESQVVAIEQLKGIFLR